jgi:hypothetical protein
MASNFGRRIDIEERFEGAERFESSITITARV